MLRTVMASLGLWLVIGSAAVAQEDPGLERRQVLAERYIELSMGDGLEKALDAFVAEMIAESGDTRSEEAVWMRANLPDLVLRLVRGMADEMAPAYARGMTEEELTTLVAFYDSPIGREIARKTVTLSIETQPLMDAAVATYTEEFMTKFCAAFTCEDEASDTSTSKSR